MPFPSELMTVKGSQLRATPGKRAGPSLEPGNQDRVVSELQLDGEAASSRREGQGQPCHRAMLGQGLES